MTAHIAENCDRTVEIEAKGEFVYLAGPNGTCYEFDRLAFENAVLTEFGLADLAFARSVERLEEEANR